MRSFSNTPLGFSLIELLVYISIIGVLTCMALPLSVHFFQKNQMDIAIKDLKTALRYARNRAFSNDVALTLNPLKNNDWSQGVALFIDNTAHTFSAQDTIINRWEWGARKVHIEWHGFRSQQYLIFSSVLHQSTANGYFLISANNQLSKKLMVNRLGHFSIKDVSVF